MKFEIDQHVIFYLQNNISIEGIIEFYSEEEAILTSLNGLSKLIIPHPERDIVFAKIVLESLKKQPLSEIKEKISTEIREVLKEPNEDLRGKSIRHLKALVAEQDRKIMVERIKNHQLGEPRIVDYVYPGTNIKQTEESYGTTRFYKKPSSQ
jgi:hypothetical protein